LLLTAQTKSLRLALRCASLRLIRLIRTRPHWKEEGQDVAEYAVMLAVILAIAIGTIKLIGANASNLLADVGSAIQ
jgi:Flp pilus assembly pilin Flp